MRFTHQALHGLDDAQQNFEQLESLAILDRLLAFGQITLSWTASNFSGGAIVTHNLGRVPQLVLATAFSAPAAGEIPALNTFTYTATQFQINGDVRTSGTFSCAVNWLAIG